MEGKSHTTFKRTRLVENVEKVHPMQTDLSLRAAQDKDTKGQGMILDVVKYHLIPHIIEKAKAKDMCDALVGIFQSDNMTNKI